MERRFCNRRGAADKSFQVFSKENYDVALATTKRIAHATCMLCNETSLTFGQDKYGKSRTCASCPLYKMLDIIPEIKQKDADEIHQMMEDGTI